MLIKNIKGTTGRLPDGYKSWIQFWEAKTGKKAPAGKIGGHVKKVDSSDNAWYIAAISHKQNALAEPYKYSGRLAKLRD